MQTAIMSDKLSVLKFFYATLLQIWRFILIFAEMERKKLWNRLSWQVLWGVLLLSGFVSLSSCKADKADGEHRSIFPPDCQLRAGDVVFRRGGSMMSHSVIILDAHGQYSHVGIVVDSAGVPMIVHAVPGEPDFDGDVDRVKMDSPERFFDIQRASRGEVCRMDDSLAAAGAADVARRIYNRHTLFDHAYNGNDTTRMYCTELIIYAYKQQGIDLESGEAEHVELPGFKIDCYFPSQVYESPLLYSVARFSDDIQE